MSPTLTKIIHYVVLVVTGVAAFAPDLPALQGMLPANAYHAIALACAVALWLMQSPLLKPFLSSKSPAQLLPLLAEARTAIAPPPLEPKEKV